jgi:hypothetical protein
VVINHGELVEQGTHEDLLRRRGLYYQLYEAQTGRSAKIEAEYAQAQAEGKTPDESAEIAMTAGAIAESEAADAIAEATARAAAPDVVPEPNGVPERNGVHEPDGMPEPVVAVEMPGTVEDPAPEPEPVTAAAAVPQAHPEAHPEAGAPDVTERVIETLENAVRQRVRAALEARERQRLAEGTAPAAQKDAEQAGNGAHANGSHDGPDGPGPYTVPSGDDAGP